MHAGRAHALCSASSASRWMECPGSVGMSIGHEKPTGPWALEGTKAHECAEQMVCRWIDGGECKLTSLVDCYGDEIVMHCLTYLAAVKKEAKLYTASTLRISVEKKVALDENLAMYGTLDLCMTGVTQADGKTAGSLIDFKYGKGIEVEAEDNLQLAFYAAAMLKNSDRFLEEVRCTIVQPRIPNPIKTVTWSRNQLIEMAQALVNGAKLATYQAATGNYTTKPGSHCRFCFAKDICLAHATAQVEGLI